MKTNSEYLFDIHILMIGFILVLPQRHFIKEINLSNTPCSKLSLIDKQVWFLPPLPRCVCLSSGCHDSASLFLASLHILRQSVLGES